MSIKKNPLRRIRDTFPQSKMVFQLWLMMMGLVLFAIFFMWMVQIYLFENNYREAVIADAWERLEPAMDRLRNGEFSDDDRFLPFLSRIMDGRLLLLDSEGNLLAFYSYGHQASLTPDEPEYHIWEFIRSGDYHDAILRRESFQASHILKNRVVSVVLGIPILYDGENSYLVLNHELNIGTILKLNRRQVLGLSLFLTLAASLLAAVCSRHFTRPIYKIKETVDRLAENDFSSSLDFSRQDEIGELARAVELLGQELQKVEKLRKEVIANISHELKSPLAVISGYAEMVRDIDWRYEDRRKEDLELIILESRRMSEMVNDILDYSKLQAGCAGLNLEFCDLCRLTESEAARCLAGADEYHIRLDFCPDVDSLTVLVDTLKLSQVLRNLLYNAINHTPEGGCITIRLTNQGTFPPSSSETKAGPSDARTFRLSVSNPGEPIPEEDRTIIWERYQRSQHENGRRLGTGIGLSIVRTILEAHQMAYGVNCENGQTVFWFECKEASFP